MSKLYFQRHGAAEPMTAGHADGSHADYDRRLTDEGKAQVEQAALMLRMRGARPDIVLSSPALRCVETAQIIGRSLGAPVQLDDGLRHHEPLARHLVKLGKEYKRPYLVGHHDNIEPALAELGGYSPDQIKPFETGEVRKFKMNDDGVWAERWCFEPTLPAVLPPATGMSDAPKTPPTLAQKK
jgi:phosphohistidine phosphatase